MDPSSLEERASYYAARAGIRLVSELGHGTDGSVFKSDRETAIKAFGRLRNYEHELQCYQLLAAKGIARIKGFAVPSLTGFDDSLMVIEMTVVTPPYLIDFAKVSLGAPPDPIWRAQIDEEGEELFEGRWPIVRSLLAVLETHGIYYLDPKPGNIRFSDEL